MTNPAFSEQFQLQAIANAAPAAMETVAPAFTLVEGPAFDFEPDHTDWPTPVPNFHQTPRGQAVKDRIMKAVERMLG